MTFLTALTASALLLPVAALSAAQLTDDANNAPPQPVSASARTTPSSEPTTRHSPAGPDPTAEPAQSLPRSAAGSGADSSELSPGRWTWPLKPRPTVVHGFVVGPARWSPGHRGVDLAAGAGAAIRAPAAGIVHFTGVIAGRPVLSIDHGAGLFSSFEPALTALHQGQRVEQGAAIGRVGAGPTHCAPMVCLHWGVRKDGRYINPLLMVPGTRGPPVLLPLR